MREILFRGKQTIDGEWVYGGLIKYGQYCCILSREQDIHPADEPYLDSFTGCIDGYATPITPDTVGQYTGLTDKNGKKIFEGDVLSIHNSSIGLYVALIEFQWQCLSPENKYYRHRLENNPQKYEVVGNIHDNPELLEVKE